MRLSVPIVAAGLALGLALIAAPAAAQSGWDGRYGYDRHREDRPPTAFDWRSQLDRPGDYRCDAFWDANRTDCGARWRDQRHRASRTRYVYGYGYDRAYRPRGYGDWRRYVRDGGTTYHGAYGRPDVVYPGGYGRRVEGRDPGRIDWCRSAYRSYDPASGYYRAYSGRLVWCG